jgi:hypothetical protein
MFNLMSSPSSGVSCFAPNVESLSCAWLVLRMILSVLDRSQVGWFVLPVQLNTSLLLDADQSCRWNASQSQLNVEKLKLILLEQAASALDLQRDPDGKVGSISGENENIAATIEILLRRWRAP